MKVFYPIGLSFCFCFVVAQDGSLALGLDFGGVQSTWSASCAAAMNVTLSSCPQFLQASSQRGLRLNTAQLNALCTADCQKALQDARQSIQDACTADSDVFQIGGNEVVVSLAPERYLYKYNTACRRDSTTNQFCDEVFFSWLGDSDPSSHNCSDCVLGVTQIRLSSPFGYDDAAVADFSSTTAACGASNYAVTSPTSLRTINVAARDVVSATPTSSAAPACDTPYTVQDDDSCDSIAAANNASSFAISQAAGVDIGCNMLRVNRTFCLPPTCQTYQVQSLDTCDSILADNAKDVSAAQFLNWNPNINSMCGNLWANIGSYICLSPPGGAVVIPTITAPLAISIATTAATQPTNAATDSNSNCGAWYTIQPGDNCYSVAQQHNIAVNDFYFLNSEINSDCTNLLLGSAYCVQPVGTVTTYSGYPSTSQFITLTSQAYNTSTYIVPSYPTPNATAITYLPTAAGTKPDCTAYVNYVADPGIVDQAVSDRYVESFAGTNDCIFLAGMWDVAAEDLVSWNPSLQNVSSCTFQEGFSYCVLADGNSQLPPEQVDHCSTIDNSAIMSGTCPDCNCFDVIYGSDNGSTTCDDVSSRNNVSTTDLQSWNSWIGSNCDSGLYAGLSSNGTRPVCIGVGTTRMPSSSISSMLSSTSSFAASSSVSSSSQSDNMSISVAGTTASSTAVNTSTSIVVTASSSMPAIASSPVVDTCSRSTKAASTTTTTTAQTSTSDCLLRYTVKRKDTCSSILALFRVTSHKLCEWNPQLGGSCAGLVAGSEICVHKLETT